eukprot:NODE_14943_length_1076_cov_10.149631.p1 GENE.NODE_14943_length_1076_cov_10.149631~~NODE_14943_length_1076_cov_10.149631.p1  ORF type:complete len:282 (-),score=67.73 NODE_14943_length_1076_cov_10.149631:159-1004(-)
MGLFVWGQEAAAKQGRMVVDLKAALAELLALCLFILIGCGSACANGASTSSDRVLVATAFGLGIVVLAYAIGPHSGGQINCAVTFSLVLGGHVTWIQGIFNALFQFIGGIIGAMLLCIVFPCDVDQTLNLGTNTVNEDYGEGRAFVGEVFFTFLLCYVVYETAVSSKSGAGLNAVLAIGFTVWVSHIVLLPIDGCSINPTRSFGPAIVGALRNCEGMSDKGPEHFWVMFFGPIIGAALAAGVQLIFVPRIRAKDGPPAADETGVSLPSLPADPPAEEIGNK